MIEDRNEEYVPLRIRWRPLMHARVFDCHSLGVLALTLAVQLPSLWLLRPVVVVTRPGVDLRMVIRPEINTTLIQPTMQLDGNLFLLVVVFSSTRNVERRQTIRRTWASPEALAARPMPLPTSTKSNDQAAAAAAALRVKVVFLLGVNDDLSVDIVSESRRNGDIIQEDFVDAYDNLTLKAIMMLKWVISNCNDDGDVPIYLMKTDDDTFVNVPRLVETLITLSSIDDLMLGSVICHGRVVRNIYDKFYIHPSIVAETFYPRYLSGSGYVTSGRLVTKLYAVAFRTPFFFLEDVYVTGMCVRNLLHRSAVRVLNDAGFSSSWRLRPMDPCVFHYSVTAHHMTATEMERIWTLMKNVEGCGLVHLELRNSHRSTCGENWLIDYLNSFT